ncbi:uncharacterized protein LOC142332846 isoform X2 [Lycorma delicatula]
MSSLHRSYKDSPLLPDSNERVIKRKKMKRKRELSSPKEITTTDYSDVFNEEKEDNLKNVTKRHKKIKGSNNKSNIDQEMIVNPVIVSYDNHQLTDSSDSHSVFVSKSSHRRSKSNIKTTDFLSKSLSSNKKGAFKGNLNSSEDEGICSENTNNKLSSTEMVTGTQEIMFDDIPSSFEYSNVEGIVKPDRLSKLFNDTGKSSRKTKETSSSSNSSDEDENEVNKSKVSSNDSGNEVSKYRNLSNRTRLSSNSSSNDSDNENINLRHPLKEALNSISQNSGDKIPDLNNSHNRSSISSSNDFIADMRDSPKKISLKSFKNNCENEVNKLSYLPKKALLNNKSSSSSDSDDNYQEKDNSKRSSRRNSSSSSDTVYENTQIKNSSKKTSHDENGMLTSSIIKSRSSGSSSNNIEVKSPAKNLSLNAFSGDLKNKIKELPNKVLRSNDDDDDDDDDDEIGKLKHLANNSSSDSSLSDNETIKLKNSRKKGSFSKRQSSNSSSDDSGNEKDKSNKLTAKGNTSFLNSDSDRKRQVKYANKSKIDENRNEDKYDYDKCMDKSIINKSFKNSRYSSIKDVTLLKTPKFMSALKSKPTSTPILNNNENDSYNKNNLSSSEDDVSEDSQRVNGTVVCNSDEENVVKKKVNHYKSHAIPEVIKKIESKLAQGIVVEEFKQDLLFVEDLSDNDEIWVAQCPKSLKVESLLGTKFDLKGKTRLSACTNKNDESMSYEAFAVPSSCDEDDKAIDSSENVVVNNIYCLMPSKEQQKLELRAFEPSGTIKIEERLSLPTPQTIKFTSSTEFTLPSNLRLRHPLLGADFSEQEAALEYLNKSSTFKKKKDRRSKEKKTHKLLSTFDDFSAVNDNYVIDNNQLQPDEITQINKQKKKKKKKDKYKDINNCEGETGEGKSVDDESVDQISNEKQLISNYNSETITDCSSLSSSKKKKKKKKQHKEESVNEDKDNYGIHYSLIQDFEDGGEILHKKKKKKKHKD